VNAYRLLIRPEAAREVDQAARWYDARQRGLGPEFLRSFRAAADALRRNPLIYQNVTGDARRVLLRRFPYSIFYEVHGSDVVILACFHEARDPEDWQRRVTEGP